MPVHAVYSKGKLVGYKWGHQKLYKVSTYGKVKAKKKAQKQGVAIHFSGYKGSW
jgi:hypothetical protein